MTPTTRLAARRRSRPGPARALAFALSALALVPAAQAISEAALERLGVPPEPTVDPIDAILSGGRPQGIPTIGFGGPPGVAGASPEPRFVSQEEAADWLGEREPVILVRLGSEAASARPVPPDLAAAYRGQEGEDAPAVHLDVTFGVSSLLLHSNLLMFDDATATLWSQAIGEGAVGVVHDEVGGASVVAFWTPGTVTALGASRIATTEDIGAVGVFRPLVDGGTLRFETRAGEIVDVTTGSVWDVTGRAVSGPIEGTRLEPVPHDNTFWFAWAAFRPDTDVRRPDGR